MPAYGHSLPPWNQDRKSSPLEPVSQGFTPLQLESGSMASPDWTHKSSLGAERGAESIRSARKLLWSNSGTSQHSQTWPNIAEDFDSWDDHQVISICACKIGVMFVWNFKSPRAKFQTGDHIRATHICKSSHQPTSFRRQHQQACRIIIYFIFISYTSYNSSYLLLIFFMLFLSGYDILL